MRWLDCHVVAGQFRCHRFASSRPLEAYTKLEGGPQDRRQCGVRMRSPLLGSMEPLSDFASCFRVPKLHLAKP